MLKGITPNIGSQGKTMKASSTKDNFRILLKVCWFIVLLTLCISTINSASAQNDVPLEKRLDYSHKKHIERGYKCQVCHVASSSPKT